ncbi:hypothetical protein BASA61_009204 [Batrachochytrium salamandrivorans]|nr:hypothetical protein BASA61_009204 [Batrachochytrium salamandrivorans]
MEPSQLKDRLLFAIPKKGRLSECCLRLLGGADVRFSRAHRLDIALSTNLPLALVFLPANDIAKFVGEGNVDIGLTGQDMVMENGVVANELLELGFGKCSLCVQVPIDSQYTSIDQLIGKRIATSFETTARRYFAARENGFDHDQTVSLMRDDVNHSVFSKPITTSVTYIGGSVETACTLGVADAIVDLVESGATMKAAKLRPIGTLMKSQAVLISNPKKQENADLIDKIRRRTQLVAAVKVTPGKRAPTVSPLENSEWVSVSSMVLKLNVVDIMDELTEIGAEDIIVCGIQNCRFNTANVNL